MSLNLCQAQLGSARREECWPRVYTAKGGHLEGGYRAMAPRMIACAPPGPAPNIPHPSCGRTKETPCLPAMGVDNRTIVLYDGGEERMFYRQQEVGYGKR